MGIVISSAIAAGPAVLEHLETPFSLLKEKRLKKTPKRLKPGLKLVINNKDLQTFSGNSRIVFKETIRERDLQKNETDKPLAQSENNSPERNQDNQKHRSRPPSRASSYSPTKRNPVELSAENQISKLVKTGRVTPLYAQYNPVEKYLTQYIEKIESKPERIYPDLKDGEVANSPTGLTPNGKDLKASSERLLGSTDKLKGISDKPKGNLDQWKGSLEHLKGNSEQRTESLEHVKTSIEEIKANEKKNGGLDNSRENSKIFVIEAQTQIQDKHSENEATALSEKSSPSSDSGEQETKAKSTLAKVVDGTIFNIFHHIDSAIEKKNESKKSTESKESSLVETIQLGSSTDRSDVSQENSSAVFNGKSAVSNGKSAVSYGKSDFSHKQESKRPQTSFLTSLDEQIKREINLKYDGLLDPSSRVSTATGQRRGKTRKIIVDSYKSLPPDRREEFEIYAKNILTHNNKRRHGQRSQSSHGARVTHPREWQF